MDTQSWQRIGEIFDEVVEVPVESRAALLDQLCAGDAELKREVEKLIRADASARQFEEQAQVARDVAAAGWAESDEPGPAVNDRYGPWRVLRELGRGGMGVVLLVERADGQYHQRAALKLIKRGMDSDAVLARFLRERQILAQLEHPHIARLLDGGIAADGRPYFAMEFVDGKPLLRFCADTGARLEQRLSLFLDICSAVQFAHGRLVVHRDIKPSNILVTTSAEAKLLDFGIAKLLADDDDVAATATMVQDRALTLAYAAPEQMRGETATVASDIYGLGILLYELLTGQRPFAFAEISTPEDVAHIVETTAPVAPSRVVSAELPVGGRRLRGDLDTIVLKALQPEAQRRYATVDAMAEDLRRHLSGRPISARRDHALYRMRKFVGRHWIGVAATAAIATALVVATVVSVYSAHIAREQAARAQTVTQFLADMFRFADPKGAPGGARMTAKEMLDAGTQRLDEELRNEPALAAKFSATLGAIYTQLGEYDRAITLLERAAAAPADAGTDRAGIYADLARAQYEKGDYRAAQENADRARQLHVESMGERSAAVASDLALDGEIARRQGDFARAESMMKQALEMSRATLAAPNSQIAAQLNQLATVYADMRRLDDARAQTELALAMFRQLYGENHLDIAENVANLGVIDMQTDKLGEALPLFEKAEAIYRKLLPGDHPLLATVLANQARALDRVGRFSDSQAKYEQALAMQRKVLGDSHPDVAATLNNYSVLNGEQGKYAQAADLCKQVLAIWTALGKPDHPMALATSVHLASALREQGELRLAEDMLRSVSTTAIAKLGEKHPIVFLAQNELAITLRDEGKPDQALVLQRAAEQAMQAAKGIPPALAAAAASQEAASELAAGDFMHARLRADAAVNVLAAMKTIDTVALSEALEVQAQVALAQGDVGAGCDAAEHALLLTQQKFGDDNMRSAQAHVAHAQCLARQGHVAEARMEALSSAQMLSRLLGSKSPAASSAKKTLDAI